MKKTTSKFKKLELVLLPPEEIQEVTRKDVVDFYTQLLQILNKEPITE